MESIVGYKVTDLTDFELSIYLDWAKSGFLGSVNGIVVKVRR